MNFGSPAVLLALFAIPVIIGIYALAQRRRRRYVVRFTAVPVLAGVMASGGVSRWRRHLPAALLLAALATLLVALAKPQTTVAVPSRRRRSCSSPTSRAPCGPTTCRPRASPPPSRPRATSSARSRRSCRSGRCRSPTCRSRSRRRRTDRDDVRSLIDGLNADGGTAAGDALQSALDALDDAGVGGKGRPPAAIILLSDGATTTGADPVAVAREAGKRDIPIYTVALGTPDGTVPGGFGGSIPVPPDPETLQAISKASGGTAYTANDADQLSGVYENLGSRLGTKKEEREITAVFAGGGLILLLGAAFAGLRTTGRLP